MDRTTTHIICAVRGSPQSRETVTHAIDLALETGARLTFFYVADAEFQGQAAMSGRLSIIYRELVEMAQFTLLILVDRAQRRGVKEVDYLVREGSVRKQLLRLVAETHADVLVMGWPIRGPGRPAFKPAELEAFVADLEREGNPRIVLAPPPE
jgi:nucleotide-binding universal stress UspA family protein